MYEENLGEVDFGSSQHEVRVRKGLSYQESTVNSNTGDAILLGIYLFWTCLY